MTTPAKSGAAARPGLILGLGLVVLLLLLSAFLLRRRSERPGEGQRTSPTAAGPETPRPSSSGGPSVPVPPNGTVPSSTPPAAPVNGGRLSGQVVFPVAKEAYSYRIYVFGANGDNEGNQELSNQDRFEFENLPPGRKAVVFFSVDGGCSSTFQVLTLPKGGTEQVVLRPSAAVSLTGQVVDSNGAPLANTLVVVLTHLALAAELYPDGVPNEVTGVGSSTRTSRVSRLRPGEVQRRIVEEFQIDPAAGRVSRGVSTDDEGRFVLPADSGSSPVLLRVMKDAKTVLKEENILPSTQPLRIVVPIR